MKYHLNQSGMTFEQIKNEADKIIEFESLEDFEQSNIDYFVKSLASIKIKVFGYYAIKIGKKKFLFILKQGRTHKLVGTKLVSI